MKLSQVTDQAGTYQFRLDLVWGAGRSRVCWVMLNPSTRPLTLHGNPTLRQVRWFSREYDGLIVVNLFGLRADDPDVLLQHPDPVGAGNAEVAAEAVAGADVTVAAWGAHRAAQGRTVPGVLWCLGVTRDGSPRHPLYVSR